MSVDSSSRKPPSSSTRSVSYSPNGNMQSQRIAPSQSGAVLSAGIGNSGGLKGLNSGWQVWSGAGSPSSQRKPLASPSIGAPQELPPDRSNMAETWSSSIPTSGSWDDVGSSPLKSDLLQLQESPSQLNTLQSGRSRQPQNTTFSGPRVDDRSTSQTVVFPQQRPVDSTTSRLSTSAPTTAVYATGSTTGFPPTAVPASISFDVEDISMSFRGMAVEDDSGVRPPSTFNNQPRPPLPAPQHPRPPYGPYLQEYSPYFSNSNSDFPYGYEAYRTPVNPSLFVQHSSSTGPYSSIGQPNLSPVPPQQPVFFENRPPGSQFFFPPAQGIMMTPQLPPATAPMLNDRKQELPYNIQTAQNIMYPGPQTPQQPLPQPYNPTLGPILLPGGPMYGPTPLFSPMMPPARQSLEAPSVRSRILDDFRANRSRRWELTDVWGHVVEFSRDQHGSRFIQQKVETTTPEERQRVFDEIVPGFTLPLITDVFGNYVIQKLFEHGTQIQRTILLSAMESHCLRLSLQMYGCRVVQKAIEHILPEQQGSIVKELEPHVLFCVKDPNGNHVIQKIIERVSVERLDFVNTFRSHVHELGTHPYGCRVLQRCFEYLPEEYSRPLLEELYHHSLNLMQDQFGNYVIQYLIEHGKPQDRAHLVAKMRSSLAHLARHKFASNVCEKALVYCDSDTRYALIDALLKPGENGCGPVVSMMKDQYGNYVLQRAMKVVEGDQKEALFSKVRSQMVGMRRFGSAYSKHLSAIEKIIDQYSNNKAK